MKNTKHPAAIRLIEDVLNCIGMDSSGTYNAQDPTHFEKGTLELSNGVTLHYNDCTWGIELTLYKKRPRKAMVLGIASERNYQSIYLSRGFGRNDDDELCPREDWKAGSLVFLKNLLPLIKAEGVDKEEEMAYRMSEDYEPDPMGCLADYE